MTKLPAIKIWFIATAVTFLTRAFLYSVWVSRGPEIKQALHLDTAGMGLFVMLYPLGGLIGVFFAGHLQKWFGSKALTMGSFTISAASMLGLAFEVPAGNLMISSILLFTMGLPMSITDYVQNFEASAINARSPRSLIAAIHSSFGVGLMLGALASKFFISYGVSLQIGFFITAAVVFVPAVWGASVFPKDEALNVDAHSDAETSAPAPKSRQRSAWTEPHTLLVAFIGLTFIVAEVSAATWIPIALVQSKISAGDAATALSMFWLAVTIVRATGGAMVDRIGRDKTVLISGITAAAGVILFALTPLIGLPFLGMLLWAAGMALGFPMAVNAMADDPARSARRLNMIIAVVYFAGMTVGPVLGTVGQAVGLYPSFVVPIALLVAAALLSRQVRPKVAA